MDTAMNNLPGAVNAASALAEAGGEAFVIAITAAYMAGLEKGKLAVLKPNPPAA